MAGVAVAGIAANMYGSHKASKQAKAAQASAQASAERKHREMMNRLDAVGLPQLKDLVLTDPQLVAKMVPELEGDISELQSEMSNVSVDPRLAEAQMDALGGLQERAQGGLTEQDVADINLLRRQATGAIKGQDATILQNMEQRGIGGSGAELKQRQMSKEAVLSRASEEADRLASQNYQAKMAALQGMGSMAGNIRAQEFGEQSDIAQNMDAIAKFNLQNQIGQSQRNVDRQNTAQMANISAAQNIENQRAANRSNEARYNVDQSQRQFENEMTKATGQNVISSKQADAAQQYGTNKAANTMRMWQGIGDAAMAGAKMYSSYGKKDNKEFEPLETDNPYTNTRTV